jgi:hypothetical protein
MRNNSTKLQLAQNGWLPAGFIFSTLSLTLDLHFFQYENNNFLFSKLPTSKSINFVVVI